MPDLPFGFDTNPGSFGKLTDEQVEKIMAKADEKGVPRSRIYAYMALADAHNRMLQKAYANKNEEGIANFVGTMNVDSDGLELFVDFIMRSTLNQEWFNDASGIMGVDMVMASVFVMGMATGVEWGRSSE